MNLKEFVSSYNLKDLEINNIKYLEKDLYLIISFDNDVEYIANGCRPSFNEKSVHLFIFKNQDFVDEINETQCVKSFNYDNDCLILELNNTSLCINNCDIEIRSNININ